MKLFPVELVNWGNSFILNIAWLSDALLIHKSNFIVCSDRYWTYFNMLVKEKTKCSFENTCVEKCKSSWETKLLVDELY